MRFIEPRQVDADWLWESDDPDDFLSLRFSSDASLNPLRIAIYGNRVIFLRRRKRSKAIDPDSPEGFLVNGEFLLPRKPPVFGVL